MHEKHIGGRGKQRNSREAPLPTSGYGCYHSGQTHCKRRIAHVASGGFGRLAMTTHIRLEVLPAVEIVTISDGVLMLQETFLVPMPPMTRYAGREASADIIASDWFCRLSNPDQRRQMVLTRIPIAGAYTTPDGHLNLPITHWSTNELMGWQTRSRDSNGGRKVRYTYGLKVRDAAPTVLGEVVKPTIVMVTEGPTDAMCLATYSDLSEAVMIVGCWASSSLPPQQWFDRHVKRYSVLSCGDGDPAGRKFNQSIANIVNSCYVLDVPDGEDVRSLIESGDDFKMRVTRSLLRDPLMQRVVKPRESRVQTARIDLSGIDIVSLVESAGSKRAGSAGEGLKYKCGLHDDVKDPSMTVNPKDGSWKCWAGCGQGGVAQFVMAWRRCSYEDAIKFLERRI